MKGKIVNFTSKGGTVSGYRPIGGVQVGVKTADGRIIKGPRPQTDSQLVSGSRVRVVNPRQLSLTGKRNQSLGIGLVGDKRF